MTKTSTVDERLASKTPQASLGTRLGDGLRWRWFALRKRIAPYLGIEPRQWARVVMDRETRRFVGSLDVGRLDALEVSGTADSVWATSGFASYRVANDICERPLATEAFDVVIAEQVFEHVLWPYRAARHVWEMLRPGGVFIVTTPFLVRIHGFPIDCSRWTPLGMKHLLAEAGFPLDEIETGSWGNRKCVVANFNGWPGWIRWKHSLRNERDFPVVAWAFARKPALGETRDGNR
jgi:SAM-dependent methyltransferase